MRIGREKRKTIKMATKEAMFVDPFIKPIRGLFANYITTLKTFKKKHSLLLATYDIILKMTARTS